MASITTFARSPIFRHLLTKYVQNVRLISTSGKKRETATIAEKIDKTDAECTVQKKKNWVSYGFDYDSEAADRDAMHSTFFFSITLCLIVGGFCYAYMPDFKMRDWAQREAYLELRRRESLGLIPIDPNFIPVEKISLPSDEELEDTEIII